MSIKYQLIQLLSDGKFHSGEDLGNKLQLTRSAIWKIIQQVEAMGMTIHRIKGKGYQIPNGFELLSLDQINHHLSKTLPYKIYPEIITELTSTNQYLLENQNKHSGTIIFAEHQTKGRGRRNRPWFSSFGRNIYCSMLWRFDKDPSELSALSLTTGIAVANALERYGIANMQLKWPNDVLFNYKKMAGILLEVTGVNNSETNVVIGIGLNLDLSDTREKESHWTDLKTITGQKPKRNLLAAYLIEEMTEMIATFQQKGLNAFTKHWELLDAYYSKQVVVQTPTVNFFGVAKGINKQGEFILLDADNKERRFMHGEVSLRLDVVPAGSRNPVHKDVKL